MVKCGNFLDANLHCLPNDELEMEEILIENVESILEKLYKLLKLRWTQLRVFTKYLLRIDT